MMSDNHNVSLTGVEIKRVVIVDQIYNCIKHLLTKI